MFFFFPLRFAEFLTAGLSAFVISFLRHQYAVSFSLQIARSCRHKRVLFSSSRNCFCVQQEFCDNGLIWRKVLDSRGARPCLPASPTIVELAGKKARVCSLSGFVEMHTCSYSHTHGLILPFSRASVTAVMLLLTLLRREMLAPINSEMDLKSREILGSRDAPGVCLRGRVNVCTHEAWPRQIERGCEGSKYWKIMAEQTLNGPQPHLAWGIIAVLTYCLTDGWHMLRARRHHCELRRASECSATRSMNNSEPACSDRSLILRLHFQLLYSHIRAHLLSFTTVFSRQVLRFTLEMDHFWSQEFGEVLCATIVKRGVPQGTVWGPLLMKREVAICGWRQMKMNENTWANSMCRINVVIYSF